MPSLRARLGVLLCLYVAQGLPTGIYNQALPAILRAHGVSLTAISLTALLAAPWALKAFWAPWVDRWYWPRLGRSRSWILPLQLFCVGAIAAIAGFDPASLRTSAGLAEFFVLMFLLNLMAATQDIATDALAVRTLQPGERAAGNSIQVAGYRAGLILGGGLLLYLLGAWTWSGAFLGVSVLLLVLTLPMAVFREIAAGHGAGCKLCRQRRIGWSALVHSRGACRVAQPCPMRRVRRKPPRPVGERREHFCDRSVTRFSQLPSDFSSLV